MSSIENIRLHSASGYCSGDRSFCMWGAREGGRRENRKGQEVTHRKGHLCAKRLRPPYVCKGRSPHSMFKYVLNCNVKVKVWEGARGIGFMIYKGHIIRFLSSYCVNY